MKKIQVIGLSGSGKSTFSRKLADKYKLKYIELDSLFWKENWDEPTDSEFRELVKEQLDSSEDGWVVDGNYGRKLDSMTWKQAEIIIFLDIPLYICRYRVLIRGFKRAYKRDLLWGKVREKPINLFNLLKAMGLWHKGLHKKVYEKKENLSISNDKFLHFTSNKEANDWLSSLK